MALEYARPGGVTVTPRVVALASAKVTDLAAPGGDGLFAFGGWLPDGNVVLVARSVWLGPPGSAPLRTVVPDLGEAAVEAQPSPRGTYVAIAAASGVSVVDLRDGTVHSVPGSSGGCHTGLACSRSPAAR